MTTHTPSPVHFGRSAVVWSRRGSGFVLALLAGALACESGPAKPAGGPPTTQTLRASSASRTTATPGGSRPPSPPSPAGSEPNEHGAARKPPLDYIEIVTGGASKSDVLPLIVAIHGLGDSPRGFAGVFAGFDAEARVLLPAGPIDYHNGHSWFPFRRDRTEAELARGISEAARYVRSFIAWGAGRRPTRGAPIVTGFSQGGMVSFAIAVQHPTLISAAFPVGGALPKPLWPAKRLEQGMPRIIALHGKADTVVPFAPTEQSVEHLRELGFPVTLEPFEGVGHSMPAPVRSALHAALADALARL